MNSLKTSRTKANMRKRGKCLAIYGRALASVQDVKGLDQSTAAEVLLRAGVLTGLIGSKNQIADAQETAKESNQ